MNKTDFQHHVMTPQTRECYPKQIKMFGEMYWMQRIYYLPIKGQPFFATMVIPPQKLF